MRGISPLAKRWGFGMILDKYSGICYTHIVMDYIGHIFISIILIFQGFLTSTQTVVIPVAVGAPATTTVTMSKETVVEGSRIVDSGPVVNAVVSPTEPTSGSTTSSPALTLPPIIVQITPPAPTPIQPMAEQTPRPATTCKLSFTPVTSFDRTLGLVEWDAENALEVHMLVNTGGGFEEMKWNYDAVPNYLSHFSVKIPLAPSASYGGGGPTTTVKVLFNDGVTCEKILTHGVDWN